MMPTTQGFRPWRAACTYLFFNAAFNKAVTSRMTTKEGRITAVVAISAPKMHNISKIVGSI